MKLPLPQKFSGRFEDWEDWSWTFTTYMNMLEPSLATFMNSVKDMPLEVTDDDLKVDGDDATSSSRLVFSRKLHYMLALMTDDAAKLIVRQNVGGNGFETWRLLCQKFTLPGTTRDVGLLSRILGHTFSESDFIADFDRWEDLKKKYERDTKSQIPDSVLIALLVGKTKGALLTHLRLNLANLKTFQQLREEILQYHKTVRVIQQDGTSKGPAPMEVDALVDILTSSGPEGLVAALNSKGYFSKGKGKGNHGHFGGSYSTGGNNFKGNFKGSKGKNTFKGNKGKGNFNRPKGKGKQGKGANFKGKGFGGKGKGKGKGQSTSSLGSTTGPPPQGTVNALEQETHTSGSETIQWGDTTSLGQEPWNTPFDTWNTDTWSDAHASDWVSEDQWVNHLSSDWDDSWHDWNWGATSSGDWSWDDSTSVVSYPTTAVGAVTSTTATTTAPPGLAAPTSVNLVHSQREPGRSTQTNTASNGTALGSRPVAGLMIATLMAVCTITGESCNMNTSDFCVPHDRYLFNDPLLVSHLNATFRPNLNTILFDSGASVHCCPLSFGENWPLLPLHGVSPELKSVSGQSIPVYGKRLVGLQLGSHVAHIQFYVCDVHFPVISVSRLTAQGYVTHIEAKEMTLTAPTGEVIDIHCTGPMFYLQPKIMKYVQEDFDDVCTSMQTQLAAVTLDSKKQIFYHADRWNLEGQNLVRLHKRPRKTLFVPTGTKDMPVNVDELAEQRITEVTYADGTTQVLEDNWVTSEDPTCVLDGSQTWTGKTLFKLKASPTGKRLRFKTDTAVTREPPLRVLSERPSSSSQGTSRERSDHEKTCSPFGSEEFRQLVLKLRSEPDPETKLERTSDTWHSLPNCWIRFHYEPRSTLFVPSKEDELVVHAELGTKRITLQLDHFENDSWITDTWQYDAESARDLGDEFTGATCFEKIFDHGHDLHEPLGDDMMARKPRTFSVPNKPSQEEILLHELTHLPFRSWCPICVKGKSKQSHALPIRDSQPVIQVDYSFMSPELDPDQQVTLLNAVDVQSKLAMTRVTNKKGRSKYAKAELKKFVHEVGRTYGIRK